MRTRWPSRRWRTAPASKAGASYGSSVPSSSSTEPDRVVGSKLRTVACTPEILSGAELSGPCLAGAGRVQWPAGEQPGGPRPEAQGGRRLEIRGGVDVAGQ